MSGAGYNAVCDDLDADILEAVQSGLPLEAYPLRALSDRLGIPEQDILHRLRRLHQTGVLRRIGIVLDSRVLGYSSALVACAVPEVRIAEVASLINRLPNVTHNYKREDSVGSFPFNMWFTICACSDDQLGCLVRRLEAVTGCKMVILPARRRFKLDARFSPRENR